MPIQFQKRIRYTKIYIVSTISHFLFLCFFNKINQTYYGSPCIENKASDTINSSGVCAAFKAVFRLLYGETRYLVGFFILFAGGSCYLFSSTSTTLFALLSIFFGSVVVSVSTAALFSTCGVSSTVVVSI
jgi:hypothetical protein